MRILSIAICLALVALLGSAVSGCDNRDTVQELTPLAWQGDANSRFDLGRMYYRGEGVPQDYKIALKWFKRAAAQGHANARFVLGAMYGTGQGVPQDYKTAMEWYKLAAAQEHADAQYFLGWMYRDAKGMVQNHIYAHMWFNIAASSGSQDTFKKASEQRDNVAKLMSPAEVSKAQKLARECVAKKYIGCE